MKHDRPATRRLNRLSAVGTPAHHEDELSWENQYGGEDGIRTHDTLLTYTPLAGERLRPLGHLSGGA